MIKGDLVAKISELLDNAEVKFRLGSNDGELDVSRIDIDGDMDEAWVELYPKAEDPDGDYYVGRHRKD